MEETRFELHASRKLVSIDRVTAEDEQMGAQESIGIEQSYDISRDSRDAVDSRGDTEFGSSAELFLKGFEAFSERVFLFSESAKEFLRFGRPWTKRPLVALAVERLYEVFPGTNLLPVKTAPEFVVLLTQVEEVLVELDGIDWS